MERNIYFSLSFFFFFLFCTAAFSALINIAPKAEMESCMINLSYKSSKIVPCLHLAVSRFVLICHFRQDLELPHFDSLDEWGLKFSLLVCNEASCSSNYVTNLLKLTLEKNSHGPVRGSFHVDEVCKQCRQCKLKVNGIWVPKTDMALKTRW